MYNEHEIPRAQFEALLNQAMKAAARKPLKTGEKVMMENPRTFREGFKFALMTLGLIEFSTTELNAKQFKILNDKMNLLLGNVAPIPEHP